MKTEPNILIISISAMGDVITSVFAVQALRKAYPELKITVLTHDNFIAFYSGIENINFISAKFNSTHKGFFGLFKLYKEIRKNKITLVADLHNILRSKILRVFLKFSGKKIAKIDKHRSEKKAMTRKFRKVTTPIKHICESYIDVLNKLGFKNLELDKTIIKNVKHDKIRIAYAPFAPHKGKVYPLNKTNELLSLLSQSFDEIYLLGSGNHEQEFGSYIQSLYPNVTSIINTLDIKAQMELISGMDCIISMDSAYMHLGSLMGVPVVSIWGATSAELGYYGLNQPRDNAVEVKLECRPCSVYANQRCFRKDYACLANILPQNILEKVLKIVKN